MILIHGIALFLIALHISGLLGLYALFHRTDDSFEWYCRHGNDISNFIKAMVSAPNVMEAIEKAILVGFVLLMLWLVFVMIRSVQKSLEVDVLRISSIEGHVLLFDFILCIVMMHIDGVMQGVLSYLRDPYKPFYGYQSILIMSLLMMSLSIISLGSTPIFTLFYHPKDRKRLNPIMLVFYVYIYLNLLLGPLVMVGFLWFFRSYNFQMISMTLNVLLGFLSMMVFHKGLRIVQHWQIQQPIRVHVMLMLFNGFLMLPLILCANGIVLLVYTTYFRS
mmetsp:Transcript_7932/g.11767  ORF Transcript_7932/g.11767 Transcript_7932/m.11767 type:complete len:277 (-) Transcript_7932:40-870(-)